MRIAFVIGTTRIAVASDSRVEGHDLVGNPFSGTMCKVRVLGGQLFVASGRYNEISANYNLWDLAATAASDNAPFPRFLERLRDSLIRVLPRVLEVVMIHDPVA